MIMPWAATFVCCCAAALFCVLQLPAVLARGMTVVVCPLLSLMQDQVIRHKTAGFCRLWIISMPQCWGICAPELPAEVVRPCMCNDVKGLLCVPNTACIT